MNSFLPFPHLHLPILGIIVALLVPEGLWYMWARRSPPTTHPGRYLFEGLFDSG
jgi:hypothetical protein